MTARRVALGIALAALVVAIVVLPVRSWAIGFVAWVRAQGPAAAVLFAVTYVVAAVLLIPGSGLTLGAGFIYGVWWGAALVIPASIAAALIAFAIARRCARAAVARRIAGHRRFEAIDRAIGQAGWKITLLLSVVVTVTLIPRRSLQRELARSGA